MKRGGGKRTGGGRSRLRRDDGARAVDGPRGGRGRGDSPLAYPVDAIDYRREWRLALAIVVALFAIYAFSSPRTVTLEDDGLFIIASMDAGVAHPPGYPLFTLLGKVFSFLPVDPPALRIHLLSGLLGALACAVLFFVSRLLGLAPWCAATVALAYGVSEHFWSQAIIAEVYTLNALLSFGVLLFCLRARAATATGSAAAKKANAAAEAGPPLCWAAFCFGLGLANHWPLMVLAFPAFALLPASRPAIVFRHLPMMLIAALLPPALLYLWMVLRSHNPEVISFYGALNNMREVWYYLSRQGYGSVDASPSAGLEDKWLFARHFFGEVWRLFTPAGAMLAALGLCRLYRVGMFALLFATAWIFCAHSLLLIMRLGFDYEFLNLAVFRPYPLVAYAMLALWMGFGLSVVLAFARDRLVSAWDPTRRRDTDKFAVMVRAAPAIALLIPALLLYKNFPVNDRRDDTVALQYGKELLAGLAPNSVLFVTGDLPTAPVGYLRYGEKFREDVMVMNTQGLVYPTRLFTPPTTKQNETNLTKGFVENAKKPVYYTTNIVDFPNPWGSLHFGLYRQATPGESQLQLRLSKSTEEYFYSLANGATSRDRWNRHLHDRLMQQFGEFVGYMALADAGDPAWLQRRDQMVAAMQNQYFGLIGMAEMLIKYGTQEHLATVQQWLDRADALIGETLSREALGRHSMSKEMLGRHYYRRGYLAFRLGRPREARRLFHHSLEMHEHPDNPAKAALKMLRQNEGEAERGRP